MAAFAPSSCWLDGRLITELTPKFWSQGYSRTVGPASLDSPLRQLFDRDRQISLAEPHSISIRVNADVGSKRNLTYASNTGRSLVTAGETKVPCENFTHACLGKSDAQITLYIQVGFQERHIRHTGFTDARQFYEEHHLKPHVTLQVVLYASYMTRRRACRHPCPSFWLLSPPTPELPPTTCSGSDEDDNTSDTWWIKW